jgi:Tfp pilus assembly protein PilO
MRKLTRFEKFGLMAALIVALTFFYVKRVYEPQEKRLKQTVVTLNKLIGEVNSLRESPSAAAVQRTLKGREKRLAELNTQLERTAVRTGAAREVTSLLAGINRMIERHRLVVETVVPKGTVSDALFDWNVFAIDMRGAFFDFMSLLETLRDLEDPVRIEQVVLKAEGGRGVRITLNLMI